MECNIGAQDKKIRIGVGIALLLLGLFKSWILFVVLGLVALVTALLNYCPAYTLLGMNTNAGANTGSATEAASDTADKVKKVAGDAKEAAGKVADKAKDAVVDTAGDVVDAAKDAVKKD